MIVPRTTDRFRTGYRAALAAAALWLAFPSITLATDEPACARVHIDGRAAYEGEVRAVREAVEREIAKPLEMARKGPKADAGAAKRLEGVLEQFRESGVIPGDIENPALAERYNSARKLMINKYRAAVACAQQSGLNELAGIIGREAEECEQWQDLAAWRDVRLETAVVPSADQEPMTIDLSPVLFTDKEQSLLKTGEYPAHYRVRLVALRTDPGAGRLVISLPGSPGVSTTFAAEGWEPKGRVEVLATVSSELLSGDKGVERGSIVRSTDGERRPLIHCKALDGAITIESIQVKRFAKFVPSKNAVTRAPSGGRAKTAQPGLLLAQGQWEASIHLSGDGFSSQAQEVTIVKSQPGSAVIRIRTDGWTRDFAFEFKDGTPLLKEIRKAPGKTPQSLWRLVGNIEGTASADKIYWKGTINKYKNGEAGKNQKCDITITKK